VIYVEIVPVEAGRKKVSYVKEKSDSTLFFPSSHSLIHKFQNKESMRRVRPSSCTFSSICEFKNED